MKKTRSIPARVRRVVSDLHRDERGAEGLEKLLIVAAIVLPLLGLLILYRNRLSEFVSEEWTEVTGSSEQGITEPTNGNQAGGE